MRRLPTIVWMKRFTFIFRNSKMQLSSNLPVLRRILSWPDWGSSNMFFFSYLTFPLASTSLFSLRCFGWLKTDEFKSPSLCAPLSGPSDVNVNISRLNWIWFLVSILSVMFCCVTFVWHWHEIHFMLNSFCKQNLIREWSTSHKWICDVNGAKT